MRSLPLRVLFTILLASTGAAFPAFAQQAPPNTADGIQWQRSLDDALAVQKATGLPLLVVVNMNGEVFNDQFATRVYHDPAFVATTHGYVCVICSPDRHTERDYDAQGNRVECPRFPGCTCSEHIAVEPLVFERWFNGTRNAPRHVGVSPASKVLFDRFLDQRMETAIDAIEKHRGTPKNTTVPANVTELWTRRDAAARRALEQQYRNADAAGRNGLLTAAAKATNEPIDLLRMALRADDDATFALAAKALAAVAGVDGVIDIEDALARTDDAAIRKALLAGLQRIGKVDPAAARLANHLTRGSPAPTLAPWNNEWRAPAFDPGERTSIEAELDRCETTLKTSPDDAETRLRLATAQAAFADVLIRDGGKGIEFWFDDCIRNARRVERPELRAEVEGLLAHALHMQSDDAAATKALAAADKAARTQRPVDPWLASRVIATRLWLAANDTLADPEAAKSKDLRAAVDEIVAGLDLVAARHAVLPENAALAAIGLLEFAGLRREARLHLERAAKSLPASQRLHDRWRSRLLVDLGAEAMRRAYARYVDEAADKPTAEWFAGYAALVAAERHTRDERRELAVTAYGETIDRFTKSAAGNTDYADTANHFMVLALAGRATLRMANSEPDGAVEDLLRAAALRPASLDDDDGLQRKPRAIAARIARELEAAGKNELAQRLQPLLN